ncbi:kinesin-like nuclear fusion protein [Phlyctochytrium planicorne]|nr:kinesin-like nuclear fusion protein [Phlyctochytrium planicorne]
MAEISICPPLKFHKQRHPSPHQDLNMGNGVSSPTASLDNIYKSSTTLTDTPTQQQPPKSTTDPRIHPDTGSKSSIHDTSRPTASTASKTPQLKVETHTYEDHRPSQIKKSLPRLTEDASNEIDSQSTFLSTADIDRNVWVTSDGEILDRSRRRSVQTIRKESPGDAARPSMTSRKSKVGSLSAQEEFGDDVGELPDANTLHHPHLAATHHQNAWSGKPNHGPHAPHPTIHTDAHGHHGVHGGDHSAFSSERQLESKEAGIDGSAGELAETNGKIGFDTFVMKDGTCVCTYTEKDQLFFFEWETQQCYPFPDEWLKEGGRFLSTTLPDPSHLHPQTSPHPSHPPSPSQTLLTSTLDPRTTTFIDSKYRKITTHLFPILRPIRFALSPETLRWEPMTPEWELEMPEIASMVDTIEHHIHGRPAKSLQGPTKTSFPSSIASEPTDPKRMEERIKILLALRERGYDVASTLRDAETNRLGAAGSLDAIADRFFKEAENSVAAAARAMGVASGMMYSSNATNVKDINASKVFRAPIYKAWEDTVQALRDRVILLETALREKDKECREAYERERRKQEEVERMQRSQVTVDAERERWRESLHAANTNLDTANERAERLEAELEVLKRSDAGRRYEGLVDLVSAKEDHVLRMRFVIGTLQNKLEKISANRRKEKRTMVELLLALRKLKEEHHRFRSDIRHRLFTLPLIASKQIQPLMERIKTVSTDLTHLRTSYRTDRHTAQLLRTCFASIKNGPPVSVLCRIRPDDRLRFVGKSPVTIIGNEEIAIADDATGWKEKKHIPGAQINGGNEDSKAQSNAKSNGKRVPRLFRFDRVFAPDATQRDLFADIEPCIPSVLDGSNLCILAYGQTGSGKTFTLQGTPASPGLTILAIQKLFRLAGERSEESNTFHATCLEIYNENVYDLFASAETPLIIEGNGSMKLRPPPTSHQFPTADHLISHVSRCLAQRTLSSLAITGRRHFTANPTLTTHASSSISSFNLNRNLTSAGGPKATGASGGLSRSHIVLTVEVKGVVGPRAHHGQPGGGIMSKPSGKLTFVDLAGSEAAFEPHDLFEALSRKKTRTTQHHHPGGVNTHGDNDVSQSQIDEGILGTHQNTVMKALGTRRLIESASVERSLTSLHTLLHGISFNIPFKLPSPPTTPSKGKDADSDSDDDFNPVKTLPKKPKSTNFDHVDSMLARILSGMHSSSTGGVSGSSAGGKTFLVVHVSPMDDHVRETTRSLAFGASLKVDPGI